MRTSRILSGYVLREVGLHAGIGFLGFAALLLSQNLLRRLDDLAAVGLHQADVLTLLGLLTSMFMAYMVPVAFLFGILLGVGRLSADAEVTAMRSCGLGLGSLLAPLLVVGLVVSGVTALGMLSLEPGARRQLRSFLQEVASRGSLIRPGEFQNLADRVFFVRSRDTENNLEGVMIWDQSDAERPFTVFAQSGVYSIDTEKAEVRLALRHGDIHFEASPDGLRYRRISFGEFDYVFDVSRMLADDPGRRRAREMTTANLVEVIARAEAGDPLADLRQKDPVIYQLQLQRRLALPMAPLVFVLVGTPLALRRTRGARSWGTLLGAVLVFGYYTLFSFGEYLGEQGKVPPTLAMWLPNLVFGVLAIPLLRRGWRGSG